MALKLTAASAVMLMDFWLADGRHSWTEGFQGRLQMPCLLNPWWKKAPDRAGGRMPHRKSAATHPTLWTGKHAMKDGCSTLSALLQLLRKELHRSGHFKPIRSPAPMLPAPCAGKGTLS